MNCGIYEIFNTINGKRYIGSSTDLRKRKWHHSKRLKTGTHCNKHLQSAYNQYGKESFLIRTILVCESELLEFYEDLIIDSYQANRSEFGYNIREVAKSNRGTSLKYFSGDKFNRVTLLHPDVDNPGANKNWICQCDCGTIWSVSVYSVGNERTKSCGCLNRELASALMIRQHSDPEWSEKHKERSRTVMTKTMSNPKNWKKKKNG